MLQNWAGPSHWKFKKTQTALNAQETIETDKNARGEGKKKTRKTKAVFYIDFTSPKKKPLEEIKKYFEQPDKATSTMLSKVTLKTQKK